MSKALIIIPAFNEQGNIAPLLKSLLAINKVHGVDVDVLVINDCSKDNTSKISKECGVKVVDLPCNLGIGGAVQTGYKFAASFNYQFAIQIDGDGQHDPKYLDEVLSPLINSNADLVIGSRYLKKEGFQSTALRRLGITYFSKLIQFVTNNKITDPTSGFRACNQKVIKLFAQNYPTDYPEPESIVYLSRIGLTIKEVPVIMRHREEGTSSITSFKSIYYMIKVSLAILIDKLRKQSSTIEKEVLG
ncbi:glycosyltransferase family 2 protein [Paenibacillus caseinilyticus]|uniref:Glycosyl transferase family 2 n=1 Tax=Paenibacillus mucilaginosus K02 TaxID=997761 RepID=I0BBC5_9BACL|nr:glycosyltransferase family 2 protein [Paenibacillus mucilaginosus]AFH59672.1 glycosyl transferase family 2 [Paenibacillus mucilaginosus K02]